MTSSLIRAGVNIFAGFAAAFCGAAAGAQPAAQSPDLNGVWQVVTPVTALRTAQGKAPPLRPAALAVYAKRQAALKTGARGFDATLRCKPMGEPRTAYEGMPFEILQGSDRLLFGYQWNRMVRYVVLGQPQTPPIGPTYYGQSVGKWEAGALVVDAIGFHADTLLDASGLPHSDKLHLTERFQLEPGGDLLREQITFEDPETFTRPWDAVITYRRVPNGRIAEDVCIQRLKVKGY